MTKVALALLFVLGACSPRPAAPAASAPVPVSKAERPTTREALEAAVVSAIKSRDGDALAPLYLTEKDVADACPADTPKDYAEHARWLAANLRASIGRDLETCARLLPDWSKAVHEKIQGGDDRAAAVGCDALEIVTDIVITYQGGGETIYIVLANALRRGDRGFILTDKIACRVADLVRPGE